MRRTRENSWQYVLFLVPAIAAGFGIQYLVKKHKGAPDSAQVASSDTSKGYREIAHEHERDHDRREDESEDRAEDESGTSAAKANALADDLDVPQKDLKKSQKVSDPQDDTRDPASVKESDLGSVADSGTCSSFELRGDGMSDTHFSNDEWTKVMDVFHESKTDLQGWLVAHKSEFPGGLVNWMAQQVENAKVQRPPVSDEPDLSWRGIGVMTHTGSAGDSTPLIRIGGGFVKMVMTQPKRARFELTRLLAQSWNPCEMPTGAMGTWEPLLKCMGLKQQDLDTSKSCAVGSESEAGWAMASAVAAIASPPGCTLPAFKTASILSCVTKTTWLEYPADATVRATASVSDIGPVGKSDNATASNTTTTGKTGSVSMIGLATGSTKTLAATPTAGGTAGQPATTPADTATAENNTITVTTTTTTAAMTGTAATTTAAAQSADKSRAPASVTEKAPATTTSAASSSNTPANTTSNTGSTTNALHENTGSDSDAGVISIPLRGPSSEDTGTHSTNSPAQSE